MRVASVLQWSGAYVVLCDHVGGVFGQCTTSRVSRVYLFRPPSPSTLGGSAKWYADNSGGARIWHGRSDNCRRYWKPIESAHGAFPTVTIVVHGGSNQLPATLSIDRLRPNCRSANNGVVLGVSTADVAYYSGTLIKRVQNSGTRRPVLIHRRDRVRRHALGRARLAAVVAAGAR